MRKPDKCRMHVQHCETCEDWEPIPFHRDGGLCLRRGTAMRRQAAASITGRARSSTRPARRNLIGLG
jgi:hypothetical protein